MNIHPSALAGQVIVVFFKGLIRQPACERILGMPKCFSIASLLVPALLLGGGCGSPQAPSGRHTPLKVTGPPVPEPGVVLAATITRSAP